MVLKFVSGQKKFKKIKKTLPQKILEKFLKNYSKKNLWSGKNFKKIQKPYHKKFLKKITQKIYGQEKLKKLKKSLPQNFLKKSS